MTTSTPIGSTPPDPTPDPSAQSSPDSISLRLAATLLRIESQLAHFARAADLDPVMAELPSGFPSPLGMWIGAASNYVSSIRLVIDPHTPRLPIDTTNRLPHPSLLDIRLTNLIQELSVIRRSLTDDRLASWADGAIRLLNHARGLVERYLADTPVWQARGVN